MEYDIFISYSRKDTAIVDEFVNRLTEAGYRVWIDRDGIYSGDQFKAKIVKAIKDSAIVLYFSSANSNASEWTVKEISYSLKKGKTIIPVKLDDTEYEDSIDFDLVNIDFIQSDPNQPSACINRLIISLAAHGCNRSGSQADTTTNNTTSEPRISLEELYSLGKLNFDNQEYELAVEFLRPAAEQRYAPAQRLLGLTYYYCNDLKEAVKWFRKAAEQGDAEAQLQLASNYSEGNGVKQDYCEAVKWYRKSAEQGNVYAQGFLAECYKNGEGIEKDIQQAIYWYRKAAEQGDEYAIRVLKRLNAW